MGSVGVWYRYRKRLSRREGEGYLKRLSIPKNCAIDHQRRG